MACVTCNGYYVCQNCTANQVAVCYSDGTVGCDCPSGTVWDWSQNRCITPATCPSCGPCSSCDPNNASAGCQPNDGAGGCSYNYRCSGGSCTCDTSKCPYGCDGGGNCNSPPPPPPPPPPSSPCSGQPDGTTCGYGCVCQYGTEMSFNCDTCGGGCMTCNSQQNGCDPVSSGTSCGACKTCDGTGACRPVADNSTTGACSGPCKRCYGGECYNELDGTDCGENHTCENGTCTQKPASPPPDPCAGKTCPPCRSCASNGECSIWADYLNNCPAGQVCRGGGCVPADDPCEGRCTDGRACTQMTNSDGSTTAKCTCNGTSCDGAGQQCTNGQCSCKDPTKYLCVYDERNASCIDRGAPCWTKDGMTCADGYDYVGGACIQREITTKTMLHIEAVEPGEPAVFIGSVRAGSTPIADQLVTIEAAVCSPDEPDSECAKYLRIYEQQRTKADGSFMGAIPLNENAAAGKRVMIRASYAGHEAASAQSYDAYFFDGDKGPIFVSCPLGQEWDRVERRCKVPEKSHGENFIAWALIFVAAEFAAERLLELRRKKGSLKGALKSFFDA